MKGLDSIHRTVEVRLGPDPDFSRGLPTWAWALLIFAGVWVILALFRAGSQTPSQGAGYSSPSGYGTGPYGGWGRSLLGGMFGAMAGEWLYDRFARGGGEAYGAREEPIERSDLDTGMTDDGQVGGVGGGDFSDASDPRDPGFDDNTDPGDVGGGDDSGGGDF